MGTPNAFFVGHGVSAESLPQVVKSQTRHLPQAKTTKTPTFPTPALTGTLALTEKLDLTSTHGLSDHLG